MKEKLRQIADSMEEIPDLKNTIIHKIILAMIAENFIEIREEYDPINEIIIGEMNALEKAAFTIQKESIQTIREISGEDNSIHSPDAKISWEIKLDQLASFYKITEEIIISSLRGRISKKTLTDHPCLLMRAGYKITALKKNPEIENTLTGLFQAFGLK